MQCSLVTDKNDLMKCIRLGKIHYDEVERRFTGLPYKPNISAFLQLFEAGLIQTVALYDGAKVEGYAMFSVSPSLFSKSLVAQEIGMFVNIEHRGSGWFKQMLSKSEKELSKRGVTSMMLAFKEGMSHNLPMEYTESETFYVKVLGG